MGETRTDSPLLYTMGQLHDDTLEIMRTINEQECPAYITNRGGFVAVMIPLACVNNLEGNAIGAAIEGRIPLSP